MKSETIKTEICQADIAALLIAAISNKEIEKEYRDAFLKILESLSQYKIFIPSGSGVK